MSTAKVRFFSPAIGQWSTYNILLPDTGTGPFPVVFQLHGLTDDCDSWLGRSNIERHAEQYPFALVFPDGGTWFYLNWKSGHDRVGKRRYEDHIAIDIASHVTRHFNVIDGPWGIGGLSMGGYGAMHIGLKYPERFASIWSHSAKFVVSEFKAHDLVDDDAESDVFAQAEKVAKLAKPPVISIDCGVDDELIGESRQLHAHMERIGLAHGYAEHAGGHTWDYWDLHVREALAQHARVFLG